jgi:hypothetical protein
MSRAEREVSVCSLTTSMPLAIYGKRAKIRSFLIEIFMFERAARWGVTICGRGLMTVYGRMVAGAGKKRGRSRWQGQEQGRKRGRSRWQGQVRKVHLLLLPAPAPVTCSCPCYLLLPLLPAPAPVTCSCPCYLLLPLLPAPAPVPWLTTVAGAGGEFFRVFLTTPWTLVRHAAAWRRVWTTSLVAHLGR